MLNIQQYRLRQEHQRLERQIRREAARPAPDSFRLQQLKKRKLSVKERLSALEAGGYAFA